MDRYLQGGVQQMTIQPGCEVQQVFNRMMGSDMTTIDSMVAMGKTIVRDNVVLMTLQLMRLYKRAFSQIGTWAMSRLWSYVSVKEDACDHRSEEDLTIEQLRHQAAVQDIAFPVSRSSSWFDRSSFLIELEQKENKRAFSEDLDAIGELFSAWRVLHNYTRASLAQELGISVDALLFLETGSGTQDDISWEQWQRLISLCRNDVVGEKLALRIYRYIDVTRATVPPFDKGHGNLLLRLWLKRLYSSIVSMLDQHFGRDGSQTVVKKLGQSRLKANDASYLLPHGSLSALHCYNDPLGNPSSSSSDSEHDIS